MYLTVAEDVMGDLGKGFSQDRMRRDKSWIYIGFNYLPHVNSEFSKSSIGMLSARFGSVTSSLHSPLYGM